MTTIGALLKNKTLVTIGIAESVSGIGDWITMMSIFAILVFRGTGGVAESGGIFMAGLLPTLPASLAAGWLCDRFDRKILMIISQLVSGTVVAGLIFTNNIVLIYGLLALQAISYAIMSPARQASLPDIVAQEDLTRANALLQQLAGIIKIGAPVIAGAILAVLDPHKAIILDVISFIAAAILLSFIPSLPPHGKKTAEPNSVNTQKSDNILSTIKDIPGLSLIFVSIFLAILIIVGFDVSASVFIRDILHEKESFMGISIGLVGVGTLIASIHLLTRKAKNDLWRDIVTGLSLLSIIPLVISVGYYVGKPEISRILLLAGCLVGGIGNGLVHVQVTTLLQTLTPPEQLGRMGGVFQSTAVAGQLVGIVLTPLLLAKLLSMGQFYAISFVCLGFLVIYIVFSLKQMKRSPQHLPKPVSEEI